MITQFTPEQIKKIQEKWKPTQKILKNPKLLQILIKEVGKQVEGEKDTIHTIIMFKAMSYVANSYPASANLFLSDESGTGKDFTCKRTLKIFPKSTGVHLRKASPQVLSYMHNQKKEPDWTWNGKHLYLEEVSSDTLNNETFLAFTVNRDFHGWVLVNQVPTELIIKGKPTIFVTSASKNIKKDNIRRLPACQLDDSEAQTKRIIKRQWKGEFEEYDPLIISALNRLEMVNVVIPYSEALGELITERFKLGVLLRTTNQRLIDLIKASAALHQYSRKKNELNEVLANFDDYENAKLAFLKTVASSSTISLTRNKRKVIALIQSLTNEDGVVEISVIQPKATFCSKASLYTLLRNMADEGLIKSETVDREDTKGRTYHPIGYGCVESHKLDFPSIEEIKSKKLETVESIESIETVETIESINQTNNNIENAKELISKEIKPSNAIIEKTKPTPVDSIVSTDSTGDLEVEYIQMFPKGGKQ
jgi:hypothetical protein